MVVGREDGDVGGGVYGFDEVGGYKGAAERGQAAGGEGVAGDGRDREDGVDDVDYAAGECYVLVGMLVNMDD